MSFASLFSISCRDARRQKQLPATSRSVIRADIEFDTVLTQLQLGGLATPTAGVGNWIWHWMGRRAIRISHFAGKWGLRVRDPARLYSALMHRNLLYPNSSKPASFIAVYHKPGHLDESSRIQFYLSLSLRYSNFSMKTRIFYGIPRYRRVWAF